MQALKEVAYIVVREKVDDYLAAHFALFNLHAGAKTLGELLFKLHDFGIKTTLWLTDLVHGNTTSNTLCFTHIELLEDNLLEKCHLFFFAVVQHEEWA